MRLTRSARKSRLCEHSSGDSYRRGRRHRACRRQPVRPRRHPHDARRDSSSSPGLLRSAPTRGHRARTRCPRGDRWTPASSARRGGSVGEGSSKVRPPPEDAYSERACRVGQVVLVHHLYLRPRGKRLRQHHENARPAESAFRRKNRRGRKRQHHRTVLNGHPAQTKAAPKGRLFCAEPYFQTASNKQARAGQPYKTDSPGALTP